jgi:hypothetical protein
LDLERGRILKIIEELKSLLRTSLYAFFSLSLAERLEPKKNWEETCEN